MSHEAWQRARRLAERQGWLLSAAQARACGLVPSELGFRLRRGECHALLREVYLLDPDLYDTLPSRLAWRAALMAHGHNACLVAGTGARLLGVQGMPTHEAAVEIALVGGVPRKRRQVDPPGRSEPAKLEVVIRQLPVRPDQVVVYDGLPVRRPEFTVVDAALDLDRLSALAVLDSGLHLALISGEELTTAIAAAKGRPGIQQLRPLARVADGRAESPLESRVRLICVDGDLPPDDLQYEVRTDNGHLVAVGDLGWWRQRSRPLLAEADGSAVHALPEPVFRDRRRGNLLTGERCDTIRFVWADTLRPSYIQYVVRNSLNAAA